MNSLEAKELFDGIREGDRAALARAITLVESRREADRVPAQDLVEACLPHSGSSIRVGVTGVPGAGKSSFIESLGIRLLEKTARRIAVLAVDPTSRLSGGSILGDKTRMRRLATDERTFIRPSPSGAASGGIAARTREAIILCEAASYDTIFVETVGVGQSETAVHTMVDFFLLLALAGAGDELQGIKRGIVEMADAIAVTKADEGNEDAAERAAGEFRSALTLFPPTSSGWDPPVRTCSAHNGTGLMEIWEDVRRYERTMRSSGYFAHRRDEQARHWFSEAIERRLTDVLRSEAKLADVLAEYEERVVERSISATAAAGAVLDAFRRLP